MYVRMQVCVYMCIHANICTSHERETHTNALYHPDIVTVTVTDTDIDTDTETDTDTDTDTDT